MLMLLQVVIHMAVVESGLLADNLAGLHMHGTGTSLGDPIEVGAASAVLITPNRCSTLSLMASKSRSGHAEAAAGSVGLMHAASSLAHCAISILHLRNLNLYVTSSMAMAADPSKWAIPRQTELLPEEARVALATGISAFAFQVGGGLEADSDNSAHNAYTLKTLRPAADGYCGKGHQLDCKRCCRSLSGFDRNLSARPGYECSRGAPRTL